LIHENFVAGSQLPDPVEDGGPGLGIDVAQDHGRPPLPGSRPPREPSGDVPLGRNLDGPVGIAAKALKPAAYFYGWDSYAYRRCYCLIVSGRPKTLEGGDAGARGRGVIAGSYVLLRASARPSG
jgi:hypothetical protein